MHVMNVLCALLLGVPLWVASAENLGNRENSLAHQNDIGSFEVVEGLQLGFAEGRSDSFMTLKLNTTKLKDTFEGRGKDKKLLQRILPLFIVPFLIQSAIVPMFLSTLKMMLVKSLMVGKLALLLIAINALRTSNIFKSRSEETIANIHYGYHGWGMEEIGAYMTKLGK